MRLLDPAMKPLWFSVCREVGSPRSVIAVFAGQAKSNAYVTAAHFNRALYDRGLVKDATYTLPLDPAIVGRNPPACYLRAQYVAIAPENVPVLRQLGVDVPEQIEEVPSFAEVTRRVSQSLVLAA